MFESPNSERRLLAELLEREARNTRRMLRTFPPEEIERRCPDCPQSARELAWSFVLRERALHYLLLGRTAGLDALPPPALHEIVSAYEDARRHSAYGLVRLTLRSWEEPLRGPIAPGRWEVGRRGELLWMSWKEIARHGAHFAVHVREAYERGGLGPPGEAAAPRETSTAPV